MTLTGPPDLSVSSEIPVTSLSKSSPPSKQRPPLNRSTPPEISMQSPYKKRSERHGAGHDAAWNATGRHQASRFSAPDIFNPRLTSRPSEVKTNGAVPEPKRRIRSKSAPRVQTGLQPRPSESSCPASGRRGREPQWRTAGEPQWRPDASPRKDWTHAAPFHEAYPVGIADDIRYSAYYSTRPSEEEALPDKPATSPHVRCRVDIKPSEPMSRHPSQRKATPPTDVPWSRQHPWACRSLTVPRHFSYSRAPTHGESLESRRAARQSCSLPNKYKDQMEVASEGTPPSRYDVDNMTGPGPGVPFQMFFEDDPSGYVTTAAPPRPTSYFPDRANVKAQYAHEERGGAGAYYGEAEHYPYNLQAGYPKSYSAHPPGPYIIQAQPARIFYGDDPRSYQIQTAPPRFYYPHETHALPPLHHLPARAHYADGPKNARPVPAPPDDWYTSYAPGYRPNPAAYAPTRAGQEAAFAQWGWDPGAETQRMGTESKPYSRSLDDILNSQAEREAPASVQRHQSYSELDPRKAARTPEDRAPPVVVNLSTSPRRYAALSLSDNSLIDQSPTTKSPTSRQWSVTPEITITDNDLRGKSRGTPSSGAWDPPDEGQHETKSPNKETSLQQSLEQLDELLADLVTDYKPPSRRASEDILDQLKKLIDEEEAVSLSRKNSMAATEEPPPLDRQPTSVRFQPSSFREGSNVDATATPSGGGHASCASAADGCCSPDRSPDEDDTMMCSNNRCRRTETLFNACLYFKSCHSCYTYYCSRNCRREDWDVHKESCVYGRVGSSCRHIIKHCRETLPVHKAFSRLAKVGYLSRGRGVLFLGFPNAASSLSFLRAGPDALDALPASPTYLSLRELEAFQEHLGEYGRELKEAGREYDPDECFVLNVSVAVGEPPSDGPSPRNRAPAVRKHAKVALASFSPERKSHERRGDMETLILTPPPGTADIDKEGEEGRKAREICFVNIQRELRIRGVFLRQQYPRVYEQLCDFVENNLRFTPTTIYPVDKRTGKQFMCMIMAASEPRTLDWVGTPHLLDDII
ncbi:apical junction component 1 homolog isoform X1 [Stigmatopora nigra]